MHRALAASTGLQKARQRLVREVAKLCVECMQSASTHPGAEPVNEEACHKFVQSASTLAHEIRLSSTSYHYSHDVDRYKLTDESDYVMLKAEMANFNVINAETGSKIRASSRVEADANGRVGIKLCSVIPSLVRVRQDKEKDLVLVKGTIVVKFDRDLELKSRKKQKDAPQPASLLDEPIKEATGSNAFV